MSHTLPTLPYAYDALEPFIDAQTMQIHHTKHHQTYVDKLNEALASYPDFQEMTVEQLLQNLSTLPKEIQTAVRNHGGGHANHSLFWTLMCPASNQTESNIASPLRQKISQTFGSLEEMKKLFTLEAIKRFGSGWAWLVLDHGELSIISTANQDSPLLEGKTPLLTIDLWEHAYYLKYQNRRPEYIESWWNVVNWETVSKRYLESI
ncbi:MAG: Superoxide dismutase [Microgenomates group bacterium GW2011_GWF2_45_18]|nr:MAG: Superoxide dismutase [Microgenomates group bacterium GW2011_GWF1_44_10]KKU01948.1 MAG: Superoxide dismutase [Microgenomates group bacterium GW2011_GWF2_45_18]OGJ41472.1 MAG: superoxide dismutase [Candidatus Pacebacteria bacterium RIFOXYB1_FULL_44_10]HAU98739.1 superoxide dismutase [Candidatus Paceibacterota bacterium]HAX01441.1 superoxide dismutase [Candidatus Paceibacterota bacterium]